MADTSDPSVPRDSLAPTDRSEYQVVYAASIRAKAALVAAVFGSVGTLALLWDSADRPARLALGVGCGLFTILCVQWANRRRIPILRDVDALRSLAARTGVPIVLYLRRFDDDPEGSHVAGDVSGSDEAELASYLSSQCLFVALGRPGEPLPPEGAYRLYLSQTDWQPQVDELIDMASLVVIRYARSPSIAWEANRLVERGKVASTMILLPRDHAGEEGIDVDAHLPPGFPRRQPQEADESVGAYPVFATFRDGACRVHTRPQGVRYGQTARELLADTFPEVALTTEQRSAIRGFYSRPERVLSAVTQLGLYGLAAGLTTSMGLVLVLLVVGLTEDFAISRTIGDFVYPVAEVMFAPLGAVLAASLLFALVGGWLAGRIIP